MAARKNTGKIILTPEQIKNVRSLASVLSTRQLCDFLGIGETAFYQIRKRQPEVMEAYKEGRANMAARIGNSLIKQALDGNVGAQKFILSTQFGWVEGAHEDAFSYGAELTPAIEAELKSGKKGKKCQDITTESIQERINEVMRSMQKKIDNC